MTDNLFDPVPPAAEPAAAGPQATASPQSRDGRTKRPARFGTIIWGMLIIAVGVTVALVTLSPHITIDPAIWITGALVIGGVALVSVGIVAVARRAD